MLLKQSTTRNLSVFITSSTDHIAGITGLSAGLTITASKDGAAFSSITPTVTELANGWYSLALTTTHTNTLGDLAIHITGAGADPTDLVRQVVSKLPGDDVALTTAERNAVADAVLDRDMSVGTDSGSPTVRTPRQALRLLRNKVSAPSGTMTVYKEDDSTSSWTAAVTTDPSAAPITVIDPA